MGRFKNAVQDDQVAGPLRRTFSNGRWRKAYETLHQDEDDRALFDAGMLIHEKLERIRSRLSLTGSLDLRATTKVRGFAAMVNFLMVQIVTKTEDAFREAAAGFAAEDPGKPIWLHKLSAVRVDAGLGQAFSADELFQAIVDGVELPLKVILGSAPDLSGNFELSKVDLDQLHRECQLGGLYSHVADLWDDCLWNGYTAREK